MRRFSPGYRPDCRCGNCQRERDQAAQPPEQPVKLGLLVIAPDDTITGAIVRREGEDWHYEGDA